MLTEVTSNDQIEYGQSIYTKDNLEIQERTTIFRGRICGTTEVAIKVYSCPHLDEYRHKTELEVLRFLSGRSSHFLKIYGTFRASNQYFIVMEYVPYTLEGLILSQQATQEKLPRNSIEFFMKSLIEGFEYLKTQGIYHCKINPKKILLTQEYKIKIAGYTNSIILEEPEPEGTRGNYKIQPQPEYTSPEICRALMNRSVTKFEEFQYSIEKSDVFSLGLICLQLATMRSITSLNNQQNDVYEFIDAIEWNFVKQFIKRMLEFDPDTRHGFSDLLECFNGKKIRYPIGALQNSSSLELQNLNYTSKDGIHNYTALNPQEHLQLNIKIFTANHEDHRKKCDYLVDKLLKFNQTGGCFTKFYGAFQEQELIWVVIEDCGVTIEESLRIRSSSYNYFSEETLVKYFRSLLTGLNYCVADKSCHNNIRPNTLFINAFGEIKLTDFSIPFLQREEEVESAKTALENREDIYEVNYLAPEILNVLVSLINSEEIGTVISKAPADVYSLGLVFYELTTLRRVSKFNYRSNSVAVQSKIDMISIVWIRNLLKRMLDYNPSSRITPSQALEIIPT